MTFNKKELKANELCSYINEGYAFTNIFNNKGELTIREKKIQNFKEAWVICFDIDHNDVPMNDFVETLTIKPTISYTTPSNGKDGYCFRLLYVLDEPITTNDEYKDIYEGFAKYLDIFDIIDAKAKDSSRYFNGSKGCNIVCNEENTLCLNDVRTIVKHINQCENESTNNKTEYIEREAVLDDSFSHQHIDRDFINDFNSLSYRDFYEKCYLSGKYISQEHTLVEDDGTKPIIELGDDFIEIIRKFKIVDFRGKKIPVRYKFQDGEGRRDKLWNNGMLRRKINPSLRFEDILYNLVSEVLLYYDNSDGQLNRTTIFSIAKSVMKFDLSKYNPRIKKRRSYIASSAYCQIHGITKRKAVAMYEAKKRSKSPLIEYYYREGLKPKDVQALIKESGEKINIRTIQNWYEKNGIYDDKYEKIFQLIDTTKSKAENGKFIRSKGFSIDDKKLLNMINEKKAMKKDVFESDEERIKFQVEMMKNKREREEVENIDVEGISSVSEPLSSVEPTTIRDEEKEAVTEEINKFYVDIKKRIKPEMTWHEKDSVKGIIQMNLFFGRITNQEAKTLSEKNNCSRLCMVNVK